MIQQRLGILPSGWGWARFGDVARLVNGRAYSQPELLDKGTPVLRIQNLNGGANWYYSDLTLDSDKYCDENDLLFAWSATFGPYWWSGPRAIYHYHIWKVLPGAQLDKRYAFYALRWVTKVVKDAAHGVTMVHMTKAGMEECKIPFPPLPEQRRIADILDKADAIRRKRKEAIALTEELLRSAFLEMFGDPVTNPKGWPVKPLGELLDAIESGWSPVCESRPAKNDEWGVLKLGAVTFGRYDANENKALAADLLPVPELQVKAGDVLFSRKNTYEHVAACVFVADTRPKLMLPDLIFRFVLAKTSGLRPETLWGLLSNRRMRKRVQGLAGGTAGSMPNISKERLKTVKVPVPPTPVQEGFAGAMRGSEATRAALEAAARDSEQLFNSIVSRAFSGGLSA